MTLFHIRHGLVGAVLSTDIITGVNAERFLITDQSAYLNILAALGYTVRWDTLGPVPVSVANDLRKVFVDVPSPNDYVRDADGPVIILLYTIGNERVLPAGYSVAMDQILIESRPRDGTGAALESIKD